jgi:biotin operon repressor
MPPSSAKRAATGSNFPGTEQSMAKKRQSNSRVNTPALTVERAARLYRMIRLLARGPQTRETLTRRLRLDMRGFYRDLEMLRAIGIAIEAEGKRYHLLGSSQQALLRLPLPDPHLTLGEARDLIKCRGPAQRKLRTLLDRIRL